MADMKDIDTHESKALGVRITPQFFDMMMRTGNLSGKCIEGIPLNYTMSGYGYDPEKDQFYLHFRTDDCPEGAEVVWVNPTFIRKD